MTTISAASILEQNISMQKCWTLVSTTDSSLELAPTARLPSKNHEGGPGGMFVIGKTQKIPFKNADSSSGNALSDTIQHLHKIKKKNTTSLILTQYLCASPRRFRKYKYMNK